MQQAFTWILTFFITTSLNAQEADWHEYKMDSIILVSMPGEVFELDTIYSGGVKVYQLHAAVGNSSYLAQKTQIEKKSDNMNLSTLPHDKNSLLEYYEGFTNGVTSKLEAESIESVEIKKDGLIGSKTTLRDSHNTPFYESDTYIINNYIYSFGVYNLNSIEGEDKDFYQKSITINPEVEISQFLGKSKAHRLGYKFGEWLGYGTILVVLTLLILLFFYVIKKFKTRGI